MSNKQTYIIFFLIIVIVCSINLISFRSGHDWGDDFAAYIDQTRALVDGNFDGFISIQKYRIENSPNYTTGPLLSPWGFSILLSPLYYLVGLDIHAMKIYVHLFYLASLIIVFLLFQDRLKNSETLLLLALIAFNPKCFYFKEVVNPDVPFLFFSFLALFLIKQVLILNKIWINKLFSYSFIGLIIFFSVEIRSIGYVLLPTLLVVQFVENRASVKKAALDYFNYIPYAIFLIFSIVKGMIVPSESLYSYFTQGYSLDMILKLVISHIKFYTFLPSKFLPLELSNVDVISQDTNWSHLVLYGVILFLVVRGIIFTIKKDYMFTVYGLFTLAILIINPTLQGYRYILPIFPFFFYFLFVGLSKTPLTFSISDKLKGITINTSYLFGFCLLTISLFQVSNLAYGDINFNKTMVTQGPYTADSMEMFDYIKRNTSKDAVIDFKKPRAMSLYTDRRCIKTDTLDELLNSPADYFVYIKEIPWWYKFDFPDYSKNLKCIFENKTFLVCELKQGLNSH